MDAWIRGEIARWQIAKKKDKRYRLKSSYSTCNALFKKSLLDEKQLKYVHGRLFAGV